jgi:hypothetical protein
MASGDAYCGCVFPGEYRSRQKAARGWSEMLRNPNVCLTAGDRVLMARSWETAGRRNQENKVGLDNRLCL